MDILQALIAASEDIAANPDAPLRRRHLLAAQKLLASPAPTAPASAPAK